MTTLEIYNSLTMDEKIEVLICRGEYIDTCEYFDHETWLYELDGLYIEIIFSIPFNKIEHIRVITGIADLDPYLERFDISVLM